MGHSEILFQEKDRTLHFLNYFEYNQFGVLLLFLVDFYSNSS